MITLYDNHILDTVTIDSFTESPYYEFDDALTDTRLSRRGRTLDVDAQWLTFDFGAAVTADYVAVLAHNFTASATVKIQANSSDSWGAPPLDETITVDQVTSGTVDDIILHNFTSSSYRYWRLYVDDSTNSDGYLEIGYIFIGEYLQMPGISMAQSLPYRTNSDSEKSLSGQLYGNRKLQYKAAEFTFDVVSNTERKAIISMFDTVDIVRPFIMIIWDNDLDVEPPIYCNFTDELEFSRLDQRGVEWSLKIEIEECF